MAAGSQICRLLSLFRLEPGWRVIFMRSTRLLISISDLGCGRRNASLKQPQSLALECTDDTSCTGYHPAQKEYYFLAERPHTFSPYGVREV